MANKTRAKSKHLSSNRATRQSALVWWLMLIGALVVGVAVVAPNLFAPRNPMVRVIDPLAYVADFIEADTPHVLVDVRRPDEFAGGHIAGALNISVETLANNLSRLPTDKPIVLYCRSGNRSAQAANLLIAAGFTDVYDLGGIITWQRQGLPVVR